MNKTNGKFETPRPAGEKRKENEYEKEKEEKEKPNEASVNTKEL